MWRCRAVFAVISLAWLLGSVTAAINLNLSPLDIDRALTIGRASDTERARFHAPYITTLADNPVVQRIEIVTELRRYVLFAESEIKKGERLNAHSVRLATEAVAPWKNRVSIVAHLRFHPLNTYVDVPQIQIELDGPGAAQALIGVLKDPVLSFPSGVPGERLPVLGARADGVFDATIIGQTQRNATVSVDGKEVAFARLDFARVE
jgi:hypothetical protein